MAPSAILASPALSSRRVALSGAGALAAFAGGLRLAAAQDATPVAGTGATGTIYVQTFESGSLFRTQGSGPDLPPYTLYLWNVVDRTLFIADRPERVVGIVPTDSFVDNIAVNETPTAILVAPRTDTSGAAEASESVWVLALSDWGNGEDPGELTYQGSLVPAAEVEARFGVSAAPELPLQDVAAGYLIIVGLSGIGIADREGLRVVLG
jgi:hypothetical protein